MREPGPGVLLHVQQPGGGPHGRERDGRGAQHRVRVRVQGEVLTSAIDLTSALTSAGQVLAACRLQLVHLLPPL